MEDEVFEVRRSFQDEPPPYGEGTRLASSLTMKIWTTACFEASVSTRCRWPRVKGFAFMTTAALSSSDRKPDSARR